MDKITRRLVMVVWGNIDYPILSFIDITDFYNQDEHIARLTADIQISGHQAIATLIARLDIDSVERLHHCVNDFDEDDIDKLREIETVHGSVF